MNDEIFSGVLGLYRLYIVYLRSRCIIKQIITNHYDIQERYCTVEEVIGAETSGRLGF